MNLRRTVGVLLVAAVAVVLTVATPSTQSPSLPFLGTWKINPAKSDMTETRLQFLRKPSGEIAMTLQGTTYDFRIDGKFYPAPFSSMATWTETGPRSWRTLYRMNNVDNNIDNYTLSADGRTLTLKTDFLVPTPSQQTMTFTRIGSGDGLIGAWQAKTLQNTDMTMSFSAAQGGQVRVHLMPIDASAVMSTDGTEVKVTGPDVSVPPGMTLALKVTGTRTFDLTLKEKGTLVFVNHGTVSADGRSLVFDAVNGPSGPTQDRAKLVYDKQQ